MQQRFDGFDVSLHGAKFTGTFDLDEEDAKGLSLDRVVVFLVAARLGRAQVETTKEGDVKRTNTFVVNEVGMLEGDLREQAIQYLAFPDQGVLDFSIPDDEVDLDAAVEAKASSNGRSAEAVDETVDVVDQIGGKKDEVLAKFLEETP